MAPDIVIAAIHDGLGNQMFQYAMGRSLADRLGAPLKLDLTHSKAHPTRPYALHHFRIRATEATEHEIKALHPRRAVHDRLRRFVPWAIPTTGPRLFRETRFYHFDDRVLALRPPVYVDGFWQSARYFEANRPRLIEDFAVHDRVEGPPPALIDRIREAESVCVHVRRGDYLADPTFHTLEPDWYRRAGGLVAERIANPLFVVFSDDPDWARANVELPGRVLWSWEHGTRAAIADLQLMLACAHFLIANSSFSWWPAWLAQRPGKIVICPARWFSNQAWDADELRAPGWIAL